MCTEMVRMVGSHSRTQATIMVLTYETDPESPRSIWIYPASLQGVEERRLAGFSEKQVLRRPLGLQPASATASGKGKGTQAGQIRIEKKYCVSPGKKVAGPEGRV